MHETNVIGTMNLFAAASQPESRVRNVVVKSSTLVYGSTHADPGVVQPRTPAARRSPACGSSARCSRSRATSGTTRPTTPHVAVSMLRFSNVLGEDIVTPITRALELPLVPAVFGYDPRVQFVHEVDVVRAIMFVLDHDLGGIFNVAGDGLLPWSEVAAICDKRLVPLPAGGPAAVAAVAAGSPRASTCRPS